MPLPSSLPAIPTTAWGGGRWESMWGVHDVGTLLQATGEERNNVVNG